MRAFSDGFRASFAVNCSVNFLVRIPWGAQGDLLCGLLFHTLIIALVTHVF